MKTAARAPPAGTIAPTSGEHPCNVAATAARPAPKHRSLRRERRGLFARRFFFFCFLGGADPAGSTEESAARELVGTGRRRGERDRSLADEGRGLDSRRNSPDPCGVPLAGRFRAGLEPPEAPRILGCATGALVPLDRPCLRLLASGELVRARSSGGTAGTAAPPPDPLAAALLLDAGYWSADSPGALEREKPYLSARPGTLIRLSCACRLAPVPL